MSDEKNEKKLRWYVVQAFSGYEKRVAQTILEHIKIEGLEDSFGEVLVPTEEVVEMRAGQKRKSERKFFPGYVLVQMDMNDASWHLVNSTARVMGFIGGTSDRPAPISQKEADRILNRLQENLKHLSQLHYLSQAKLFVLSMVHLLTSAVLLKKWITKRAA